jgi:putative transposase
MRKGYPTDLSDQEWEILEPLLPPAKPGGRPREQDMREILNAIFYILRAGCSWSMLPKDFPNQSTVFYYFNTWRKDGSWKKLNDTLRCKVRVMEGRKEQPSAGILDSQSVKTADTAQHRGYDAGKKINGRKRHILVDSIGLLLMVVVHVGNLQDRDGAKLVFNKARFLFPTLKLIWADGGYAGKLIEWVFSSCAFVLQIVKRNANTAGFYVLPRRWVVERTFGWFMKYRRMCRDYEYYEQASEAVVYACMIHIMLRRLAR